mmetsp:Transcript_35515/g.74906  ORF Transcript_35515/g.74906 Transcript_35515/m.74906 type:complete len:595 (+) Transcript_35515:216-2000(+)|eukprot:CAMPEP_0183736210 /NCGR_PEP_ID=MMETSP0737-20130205/48753_1 /TAXON_ID=385413 /ORGANISM="Thalassiosira miniscula, Strain CCMP1093" /LENGTH=594 /DNA_ID=CAMNT_0025970157 /DNA_START=115 /DNA_END=1899 /DNA_ORIENTATION=+
MTSTAGLTTSLIPCCTCGAIIAPNPSNQCASCLATVDIGSIIRRGPGGGDLIIHQCRQCRKFDRTGDGKHYLYLDPESPELMAVLLKQIPALSGKNNQYVKRAGIQALKILDSMFIWTEPNSMRMRVMLTIKADINDVSIQQRIKVEFIVQWKQCPNCIKESRQRTWQAIVQLRQKRDDSRKGLLILELAIARNSEIRKDILSVQTKKNGFDFYFPSVDKARHFTQYLAKAAPMRTKTTQSLVSEDKTNNTANIKYTLKCDMVPLCRDDLIVVEKRARGAGNLSGRLCLVLKMSSMVHLVDAAPARDSDMSTRCTDLHSETYWKSGEEKSYRLFLSPNRLVRFVVLDVELCCEDERERYRNGGSDEIESTQLYHGPQSGVSKYALADVEVARESDFGVNDETFRCVTHLGHLLQVGDTVLGYDITSTVLSSEAEWSMENAFNSSFVVPDVVLVRKVKGTGGAADPTSGEAMAAKEDGDDRNRKGNSKAKSSASRKRERRMKKEEQKQKKLEEAAARMGLDTDQDLHLDLDDFEEGGEAFSEAVQRENAKFEEQLKTDEDLADDLALVEKELAIGIGDMNIGKQDDASKQRDEKE